MANMFGAKANRVWWRDSTFTKMPRGTMPWSGPSRSAKSLHHQWSRTRTQPLSPSLRNKLLHVFAQQISFEVNGISNFSLSQCRDFVSVRYDPDAKALLVDARDRQADAIHRNRTLGDDITHHFGRRGDVEHVVLSRAFP